MSILCVKSIFKNYFAIITMLIVFAPYHLIYNRTVARCLRTYID